MNDTHLLLVHTTATDLSVGLSTGATLIGQCTISHREVSRDLVLLIREMLARGGVPLEQLSAIACTIGPAPFTTLRSALATVNGIAFVTQIPLIGINSMLLLARVHGVAAPQSRPVVVLMNAYAGELYYAEYDPQAGTLHHGIEERVALVDRLHRIYGAQSICFAGNGVELVRPLLVAAGFEVPPAEEVVTCPSLAQVARAAQQRWEDQDGLVNQVMPYYGKRVAVQGIQETLEG